MTRTSTLIVSSATPSVLEIRILASHGTDPRFGFLRGRWQVVWDGLLSGARETRDRVKAAEAEPPKPAQPQPAMLLGIADYGSSADESEAEVPTAVAESKAQVKGTEAEERAKRLARAKEWTLKRKQGAS